ncbi:MAG TPA: hypothetical protein VNV66_20305, partial [Pilimelia sp.]|nr:hypothetical protein [Pilimelia sp.]
MARTGVARWARVRRLVPVGLAAVLTVGLAVAVPGQTMAAPGGDPRQDPKWLEKRIAAGLQVPGTRAVRGATGKGRANNPVGLPSGRPASVAWPASGSAVVDLAARVGAAAPVRPGGLPVRLARAGAPTAGSPPLTRAGVD